MDDEIDIEEHDLMDNPVVRNIFPDLSVLKKEIQYYEEGSLVLSEPVAPESSFLERVVIESNTNPDAKSIPGSVTNIKNFSKQLTRCNHTGKELNDEIIENSSTNKKWRNLRKRSKEDQYTKESDPRSTQTQKLNHYSQKNTLETNFMPSKSSKLPEQQIQKVANIISKKVSDEIHENLTKRENIFEDDDSVRLPVKRRAKDKDNYETRQKVKVINTLQPNNVPPTKTMPNDVIVSIPEINLLRSKIIIGSKPNKTSVIQKSCSKIIIGSKPNKSVNAKLSKPLERPVEVKVMLQDINSYLNKTRRFCVDCQILFPNGKTYSNHKHQSHSPKNTQNKAIIKSRNCIICELCHTSFSLKTNLLRHKRNIHGLLPSVEVISKNTLSTEKLRSTDKTDKELSLNPCFHCDTLFETQQLLIDHLYNVMEPKEKRSMVSKLDGKGEINNPPERKKNAVKKLKITGENGLTRRLNKIPTNQNKKDKRKGERPNYNKYKNKYIKKLYSCPICSQYFYGLPFCVSHMSVKHKINQSTNIKIVKFNPKCKYCSFECSGVRPYNYHLFVKHRDKLNKNILSKTTYTSPKKKDGVVTPIIPSSTENFNSKLATKSVLFKCIKCDINFLTANNAMNHSKHMELLINWKCPTCNRIFKESDHTLHLKQHTISDDLIALELSGSELKRVLYNCPKCTIHFTENKFFEHYHKCASETAQSTYCKVCDTLIFIDDSVFHEYCHKKEDLKSSDFTVIDGDIILDDGSTTSLLKTKTNEISSFDSSNNISVDETKEELLVILSYCNTCKCFVSYVGSTRKVHLEARCSHIITYICKSCGLKITQNGIKGHRKLHKKRKDLKLQDFLFYELNGTKPIRPPIPEFPHCENCKVYFVSRVAIMTHDCSEDGFVTCEICILKFSEAAFKLHMMFHEYTVNSDELASTEILDDGVALCETSEATTLPDMPTESLKYLYMCDTCTTTLSTYDKVVEHCQDHFAWKHEQILFMCSTCDLKFERECYDMHERLHILDRNTSLNSFKILRFDMLYFTTENDIWNKHILGSLSSGEIKETLRESIYKYECRIKMEVIQDGPGYLSVYKCYKCSCFIDPQLVFRHVESSSCIRRRNHPCSHCGLPFISVASRMDHEKVHEHPNIRLKSYRIILFNREADASFNKLMILSKNLFVLYQCRNCNGLVNKCLFKSHKCNKQHLRKCTHCGLLVYEEELMRHMSMHDNLPNFQDKYIKVVLLGNQFESVSELTNVLMPSFSGVISDYTFYQCVKCAVCIKNKKMKHTCNSEDFIKKCSKCDLFFVKNRIQSHIILHDKDLDFVRDNMQILPLTPNNSDANNIENDFEREYEKVSSKNSTSAENIVKIYKCFCGLHFVDEQSAVKHQSACNPKIRISKQNCSKCELLFTPNNLFNHLLVHHGDKNRTYKFDIVEISKQVMDST